jgi:CubicO group peptidase (beta-lactamase class C family)
MNKNLIFPILLLSTLCACIKDEAFKNPYNGYEPLSINDDWVLSNADAENINRNSLKQAFELIHSDKRYWMARSLLVIRNGKLVAEAYPHHQDDIHKFKNIQSCTKSMTSILAGVALQDKVLESLDEKLYDIFPDLFDDDQRKRAITVEDALTMRAGLAFDNDTQSLKLYQEQGNSTKYVLSQNYLHAPGTIMNYNDGAPHLVSKAIEQKAGKNLAEYADEKLFKPLNIKEWKWEAAKDGTTFGAYSLFLKPRDLAKIGQLLLQNGIWNDQRIIDSQFLNEAVKTKTSMKGPRYSYGYYFWIIPELKGYAALGHGGQFLLVVPEKQLVVVYTSWPYTSGMFFDNSHELMSLIVKGCI